MSDRVITPADETSMTIETVDPYSARITIERGNGDSVESLVLSTLEWRNLRGLLDIYGQKFSDSAHFTFKVLKVER